MKGKWYLVGQHYERHHLLGYRGVCGDWWGLEAYTLCPHVELYDRLMKSREYVVSPEGYYRFYCTNEAIASECFEHMAKHMVRVVWLEASFFPLSDAMGIDFGYENWSIVANEILEDLAGSWIKERLNQYQLFSSVMDLEEYILQREAFEEERGLEHIGSVEAVWVKTVTSTMRAV